MTFQCTHFDDSVRQPARHLTFARARQDKPTNTFTARCDVVTLRGSAQETETLAKPKKQMTTKKEITPRSGFTLFICAPLGMRKRAFAQVVQ